MKKMTPIGKCPCEWCDKNDTYCTGCSDFRIWAKISWRKLRNFFLDIPMSKNN